MYILMLPFFFVYGKKATKPRVRIIVQHNDTILFVRNWLGLQRWSLPGGGVNPGEAIEAAAIRELLEEVGIHTEDTLVSAGVSWSHEKLAPYKIHLFVLNLPSKPTVRIDGVEIFDFQWITMDDLDSTINPRLQNIVMRALEDGA